MTDLMSLLSLSPNQARSWAGAAFVALFVLDILASEDDVPGNTPREWLLRMTRWRSPTKWLPLTGAAIPFAFGGLIGHFFHPWIGAPVGVAGSQGMFAFLVIGAGVSVLTYFRPGRRGARHPVFFIAVLGLATTVLLWPAGVAP